jgi:transposase-like protein
MDFPIGDLLDHEKCTEWIQAHFHPDGLPCPACRRMVKEARVFRTTRRSRLKVYRCVCGKTCTLYSGTVFAGHHLTPVQIVLLMRGLLQGQTSAQLARELGMAYSTVLGLRHELQAQAQQALPSNPLPDVEAESDEMFQNSGEKGIPHRDPLDPPRRRANKQRGRGTYANDRPPILGVVGRNTGQIRLQVVTDTKATTLCQYVHGSTRPGTVIYTDELASYVALQRPHQTVSHAQTEWARDDDGDTIREVHINTLEGFWTGLRNFLRPFRGVHKRYLAGYVAIHQVRANAKRLSAPLVARLVPFPSNLT